MASNYIVCAIFFHVLVVDYSINNFPVFTSACVNAHRYVIKSTSFTMWISDHVTIASNMNVSMAH